MSSDVDLLREFAWKSSEQAFAALVQQRMPLVYSLALRQVNGDSRLAEEVTQSVFVALAKRAPALCQRNTLGGWLCQATQFTAIDAIRGESRRRKREAAAEAMKELNETPEERWGPLRPALDRLINELSGNDRDALVMRYYDHQSFAEIAAALKISEDGARKRVIRSTEKLRIKLQRIGVASTAAALSSALLGQTSASIPAGLGTVIAETASAAREAKLASAVIKTLLMKKTTTVRPS